MKTAYMMMRHYAESNHLAPKFEGQIKALKNLGYDVSHLIIKEDGIYLAKNNVVLHLLKKGTFNSRIGRILSYKYIHDLSRSLAKEKGHYDFVYVRYVIPFFSYAKTLKVLKSVCPKVVVEIPTYPHQREYKNDRRLWRKPLYPIMEILNRRAARYVDLYSLIGDKADTCYLRPAINISNGITVKDLPIKKQIKNQNEIHLIAVASMAKWHGYDRLIEGLHIYKQNGGTEKIILHMVGPDGDGSLAEWREIANNRGLQNEVLFEGPMYGKELTKIFDRCDVAVASLGAYRKGMNTASELKIREYMSRGIPFIYSLDDNSIKNDLNYCLKVTNDSTAVDIEQIIKFARNTGKNKDVSLEMRAYANEHMSWDTQFNKIFDWFQQKR